ncbi:hypothetical protein KSC_006060 [Ktedonobacter sp. SOSP1-52]|nr:hypothetical protein KSC_006060 [Ktedonobacter sp. SOSP1-52]
MKTAVGRGCVKVPVIRGKVTAVLVGVGMIMMIGGAIGNGPAHTINSLSR